MVQVLFGLSILTNIGMLLLPISSVSRGKAVWSWASNWFAGGAIVFLIEERYPSWKEPQWHSGIIWFLVSWALFITGFVVAVRKPRKRDVPAA